MWNARNVNAPNALRREVNRLFDDFLSGYRLPDPFGMSGRGTFPALNVWEKDDRLYAEAEVPGLSMQDMDISVMGNELTIRGERKPHEREEAAYHRRERGSGAFSRVLRLPVDIDPEQVSAELKHGVLTVSLPKAEAARPRKIEVKAVR